jgi:Protein of unknown function (DUF2911)
MTRFTNYLTNIIMTAALLLAVPLMAQDQQKPLASPRDTTRATIGSAHLLVDYGRPSKRGREIFGGLVPWNVIWRTGANAATTFTTDKDLTIGGTPVPAGTYTLYSLPQQKGPWSLVISKETGQWGTEYHQDKDLARIPMTVSTVSQPVEKFAITIVPQGNSGTLQLVWDTTQASVPIVVR